MKTQEQIIKEKTIIKEWSKSLFDACQQDYMAFDSDAEYSEELSIESNKELLREKIKNFLETNKDNSLTKKQITELELKPMDAGEVKEMQNKAYDDFKQEHKEEYDKPIDLDKINVLCVLGEVDEGKTNLCWWYIRSYKGERQIYLFGYPKKIAGCKPISTFQDLLKVKNGVIFFDEIAKYFKFYDKNTNMKFLDFLSLMSHKKNTIIMTTQLTQMLTRPIEAMIDAWAFKRMDLTTLKWGSKPKRIIDSLAYWKKNDFVLDLEKDEYFEYSSRSSTNGIKRFPFMNVGKEWA